MGLNVLFLKDDHKYHIVLSLIKFYNIAHSNVCHNGILACFLLASRVELSCCCFYWMDGVQELVLKYSITEEGSQPAGRGKYLQKIVEVCELCALWNHLKYISYYFF